MQIPSEAEPDGPDGFGRCPHCGDFLVIPVPDSAKLDAWLASDRLAPAPVPDAVICRRCDVADSDAEPGGLWGGAR